MTPCSRPRRWLPSRPASVDLYSGRGTLVAVTACVLVALAVSGLTGPGDSATHLVTVLVVSVAGLLWAAAGAWRHRRELGAVGALLVAALSAWCIGAVGWDLNVLVFDRNAFPSWTDGFFLLAYPLLIAAALTMVRRREVHRDVGALIDAAILTVGAGVVAYAFVLVDAAGADNGWWLGRVVAIAYPLGDVLVVGVLARMLMGAAAWSRAGLLLVGSISCLLFADVGFVVAYFAGAAEAYDGWLDAPYMLFFLLVGLALQQRDVAGLVHGRAVPDERLRGPRMVALGVGLLLAPLTLMAGSVASDVTKVRGAAIGAGLMFLLAMARMGQLIRAVERNSDLLLVQARTDALTGLPNRRTFDFELHRTIETADTTALSPPLSVAMIDLDRFKSYNDTRGHAAGDLLLQQAATAWRVALLLLAPAATLARYGGEEFAIVLPGVEEQTAATVLCQLLALTPEGQTFSAGVAERAPDESPMVVLGRADLRLYAAKAAGRARVVGGPAPTIARLARPQLPEAVTAA